MVACSYEKQKIIMENKTTDINDLVLQLAAMAMKPVLNDEVWQCYGYKRNRNTEVCGIKFPLKCLRWIILFQRKFSQWGLLMY